MATNSLGRSFQWLHLSDLHLDGSGNPQNRVMDAFVRDVPTLLADDQIRPDCIFVTGDVTLGGEEDQFTVAANYFRRLVAAVEPSLEADGLLVVPGNHDVHWPSVSTSANQERLSVFSSEDKIEAALSNPDERKLYLAGLAHFANFSRDNLPNFTHIHDQPTGPLHWQHMVPGNGGFQVRILGLTTCWRCCPALKDRGPGNLFVGVHDIRRAISSWNTPSNPQTPCFTFAVGHHPLYWIHDIEERATTNLIHENCDFYLRGHDHRADCTTARRIRGGQVIESAAGAVFQHGQSTTRYSFSAGVLNPAERKCTFYYYHYKDDPGAEKWLPDYDITEKRSHTHDCDLPERRSDERRSDPKPPTVRPIAGRSLFVGRKSELDSLKTLLVDERTRIVIVHGLPGVGKSTLIDQFLMLGSSKAWFPGGVRWLGREDAHAQRAAQISYAPLPSDADSMSALVGQCAGKGESLIVIDDVTSDTQVAAFVQHHDSCQILVLSRLSYFPSVMGLGADNWKSLSVQEFSGADARELLHRMLGPLTPSDDSELNRLAQRVGRLPLGLHWVGTLYHHPRYAPLSVDDYLAAIDKLLSSECGLNVLFEHCVGLLAGNDTATSLLLAMLLFDPSDVPIDSLRAVAGIQCSEWDRALEDVMALAVVGYGRTPASLSMHSLVHEMGRQSLMARPEYDVLSRRFARLMMESLLQASSYGEIHHLALHIRMCVRHSLEAADFGHIPSEALGRLSTNLFPVADLVMVGASAVRFWGFVWEYQTTAACNGLSPTPTAACAMQLGKAHLRVGEIDKAQQCLEWALDQCPDDTANALVRARALALYGELLRASGHPREAIKRFREAISVYESQGVERVALGGTYRKLSRAYLVLGQFGSARCVLETALAIHREQASINDVAYDTCLLGTVCTTTGDFANAELHLRKAVELHTQAMGEESAYVAYDLNRLGEALRRRGNVEEAIGCLTRAIRIHEMFYGLRSSNVALDTLRLGEAHEAKGDHEQAEKLVREAFALHSEIFGIESVFCAYDLIVLAAIHRAQGGRLEEARVAARSAMTILEARKVETIHLARARTELGAILAQLGEGEDSQDHLWKARRYYTAVGLAHDVDHVDALLLASVFANNSRDWSCSAEAYASFLKRHPHSLLQKLARKIATYIRRHLADEASAGLPCVIDLCCGTGLVSQQILQERLPVHVVGLDTTEMISIAKAHQTARNSLGSPQLRFKELSSDWATSLKYGPESIDEVQFVTMSMSIFQFSPRQRHLLFRSLMPLLADGAILLLSTASPDFRFDNATDATNPFKETLFRAAEEWGLTLPTTLQQAVAPTYAKDSRDSFRHFLSLYGISLLEEELPILEHERTIAERVDFTRMQVISNKVFGEVLPDDFWTYVLSSAPTYKDKVRGTVISAQYRSAAYQKPVFLSGKWGSRRESAPVRYATAAVLQTVDGEILMVKRGAAARDFHGSWSFPSSMARPGVPLTQSMRDGLERNVGISDVRLRLLSVRLSPRVTADGEHSIIAMCLFAGKIPRLTPRLSEKYKEAKWVTKQHFQNEEEPADDSGDCVASYREVLARQQAVGESPYDVQ